MKPNPADIISLPPPFPGGSTRHSLNYYQVPLKSRKASLEEHNFFCFLVSAARLLSGSFFLTLCPTSFFRLSLAANWINAHTLTSLLESCWV